MLLEIRDAFGGPLLSTLRCLAKPGRQFGGKALALGDALAVPRLVLSRLNLASVCPASPAWAFQDRRARGIAGLVGESLAPCGPLDRKAVGHLLVVGMCRPNLLGPSLLGALPPRFELMLPVNI